jgi:hypothetical protein
MNSDATAKWLGRLTGPAAAALVLAAFWVVLLASLRDKSLAYDEIVHATAGYTYWKFNDYRLNPENGNLPQRLAALPLLSGRFPFPTVKSEPWRASDEWVIADQWFNRVGNDMAGMLWRGRAACGLLALALGAVVWACARRLFGPAGGMLSLLLYVLNPTVLANGGLMLSDTAASLFFLASPLCLWALLRRLTPLRLALSGLVMGCLFVSKASAPLILPVSGLLLAARVAEGGPLPIAFGAAKTLVRRRSQALALAAVAVAHAILVVAVIWAFFGFRYDCFAPAVSGPPGADKHYLPWTEVLEQASPALPPTAPAARAFSFAMRHHLLPEAFIYGTAYAWRFSGERGTFLNGAYSLRGWPGFFPYTFLVKTPLALFGVMALAAAAAVARWRGRTETIVRQALRGAYATLPLWALFACYWVAAILSHVDIGHRHIFPTYGPLFVLCGSAAVWPAALARKNRLRSAHAALAVLVAALAAEIAWRFPNYVAYFNGIVSPAKGYLHLVDSSFDWGQELPAVRKYIEMKKPAGPLYLSYFGSGSPVAYGIPAELTNCILPVLDSSALPFYVQTYPRGGIRAGVQNFVERHPEFEALGAVRTDARDDLRAIFVRKASALRLHGGTYFVSATVLESVKFGSARPWDPPWGPWNSRDEHVFQQLAAAAKPFLSDDPSVRAAAVANASPDELWLLLLRVMQYDEFRFARLKAYLRHRGPDDNVNYGILVYRLSDREIDRAVNGPPPELGPDVSVELEGPVQSPSHQGPPGHY